MAVCVPTTWTTTESPTDDDEGTTISDDDGYEDGVDIIPTKKNRTTIDDSYDY